MAIPKSTIVIAIAAAVWFIATPASALSALEPWNTEARLALQIQIKVWLGLLLLTNLASLAFVKNHVAARWVFGGFFVSHAFGAILWSQGVEVFVGQVSISHIICWTPGAIVLILKREEIKPRTPYGIWASLALFFYVGSMIFDIRDATIFLHHLAS